MMDGIYMFSRLVLGLAFWLIEAWVFMVGVGVVHGEWLPGLPTVGYWSALLINIFIGALVQLYFWDVRSSVTTDETIKASKRFNND